MGRENPSSYQIYSTVRFRLHLCHWPNCFHTDSLDHACSIHNDKIKQRKKERKEGKEKKERKTERDRVKKKRERDRKRKRGKEKERMKDRKKESK